MNTAKRRVARTCRVEVTAGIPRTVAIGFFPHGAGYAVAGSGSESKQDPQWFRNLRTAAHAQIQIGATRPHPPRCDTQR